MKYERFIPKGSVKVTPKSGGVVFYLYKDKFDGRPSAVCFVGRAVKATWHHWFSSDEKRAKKMAATVAGIQAHAAMVAKRKEARSAPHKWEAGLILKGSWGCDQTNVDFFEVVKVIGQHMVEIQQVGSQSATDDPAGFSSMSSHVVPDLDHREAAIHRVKVSQGSCKSPVHGSLSPWSGKPVYCSWYA